VECGANTKELLSALAAAQAAQRTSIVAKDVTLSVSMLPDSPPHSLEEWQRANLQRIIQDQRDGKIDGGLTPPITRSLCEGIPFSDVAALVAVTEPSSVLFASSLSGSTSQAPHPSFGGAVVKPAIGSAYEIFQPDPGHVKTMARSGRG
jgi:hypothetical protein